MDDLYILQYVANNDCGEYVVMLDCKPTEEEIADYCRNGYKLNQTVIANVIKGSSCSLPTNRELSV